MKKTVLFTLLFTFLLRGVTTAQNPYESIGKEMPKGKILTLTNGKYPEVIENDTLVRIGSVMFNTVTGEVVAFLEKDTLHAEYNLEPDVVSRWLSPDPLTEKYLQWSPYVYTLNNPVRFIDPDGMVVVDGNGNIVANFENQETYATNLGGNRYVEKTINHVTIFANDGTPVSARQVVSSSVYTVNDKGERIYDAENYDPSTNCHGLSFANGALWINNEDAADLIEHDKYQKFVSEDKTDIVVLYNGEAKDKDIKKDNIIPVHSATKTGDNSYTNKDGNNRTEKKASLDKVKTGYETTKSVNMSRAKNRTVDTKSGEVSNGVRLIRKENEQKEFEKTLNQ